MQAGRGASGAVAVGGAWGGLGGRIRLRHPPPAAAAHSRVWGGRPASRQLTRTALHLAADNGHAPCVESLLKARADASLKDYVSNGAEGRGGRRGGLGRGLGLGGGGALRSRRAASPRRPTSAHCPRDGRLHLRSPPSLPQAGKTASDMAKERRHTEVVQLLEKYTPAYFAAQVGHPATRRAAPSLVHNPPRLIAVPRERYLGAYLLLSTHTAHHSLRIQANSNPEGAGRL